MNSRFYHKGFLRGMMMVLALLTNVLSFGQPEHDTLTSKNVYQPQVNHDSIDARMNFVRDSIQAREKFVRDSVLRRKQILDSLVFLQVELQPLLEAIQWTMDEDIISRSDKIEILGDSVLGDFVYYKHPLILSDPFCPWKIRLKLNDKRLRFNVDKKSKKISTIQAPFLKCSLSYANQGMIIIIQEDYTLQKNSLGNFFRIPIDSVFYDHNKRVVKIKRYIRFYNLAANNQKGELLFTNLMQVKQYQYASNNQMSQYELVKFCERYKSYETNTVCSIVKYGVTKQDNNYLITRRNNPANEFSDGTFTLEYDEHGNVKCLSFKNMVNSPGLQQFVQLNKEGNVDCYLYKLQGVTISTRCMFYHNELHAKYPVEIIKTLFEKDGVDYVQTNMTTDKTRVRNRMTLEWGPWK